MPRLYRLRSCRASAVGAHRQGTIRLVARHLLFATPVTEPFCLQRCLMPATAARQCQAGWRCWRTDRAVWSAANTVPSSDKNLPEHSGECQRPAHIPCQCNPARADLKPSCPAQSEESRGPAAFTNSSMPAVQQPAGGGRGDEELARGLLVWLSARAVATQAMQLISTTLRRITVAFCASVQRAAHVLVQRKMDRLSACSKVEHSLLPKSPTITQTRHASNKPFSLRNHAC